jgi:hypothetical protein
VRRTVNFVLVILSSGTHKCVKVAMGTGYAVFTKFALLRGKHTDVRADETYMYDFLGEEGCTR